LTWRPFSLSIPLVSLRPRRSFLFSLFFALLSQARVALSVRYRFCPIRDFACLRLLLCATSPSEDFPLHRKLSRAQITERLCPIHFSSSFRAACISWIGRL